jgi:hypothetical protein
MTNTTTPMFGSANTTGNLPQFFTGLTSFTVLGINPSKEQIEDWKSEKYNLNVDYSIKSFNNVDKKPIDIWLKSADGCVIEPLRYTIGLNDVVSLSGNYQFVNSVGNFTYSASEDTLKNNSKMDWFTKYPMRKAKVGEEDLYGFMKALMNYNANKPESNFISDAENNKITPQELFEGNLTGLKAFIDWCNENKNELVALCAVRKTEKLSVEGLNKIYYNQMIVPKSDYLFAGKDGVVSNRCYNKIQSDLDKGVVVTNAMFTIAYSLFKESESLNKIPDNKVNIDTPKSSGLEAFLQG